MVQIQGRKRWRLWRRKVILSPSEGYMTRGRNGDDVILDEELGEPYIDIVLEPGDILYVPRGVLHSTSVPLETENSNRGLSENDLEMQTSQASAVSSERYDRPFRQGSSVENEKGNWRERTSKRHGALSSLPCVLPSASACDALLNGLGQFSNDTSLHLTVSIFPFYNEYQEDGRGPFPSLDWGAFFGGGRNFSAHHEHFMEGLYRALGNLVHKDDAFRRTVPRALKAALAAPDGNDDGRAASFGAIKNNVAVHKRLEEPTMARSEALEEVRSKLYALVDEMVDGTDTFGTIARSMERTLDLPLKMYKLSEEKERRKRREREKVITDVDARGNASSHLL
jgi:hypothetical protein